MGTLQLKQVPTVQKGGFGQNANALIIAKKGFDDFLYRYNYWHFNRVSFRSKAWLPVVWPQDLNDEQSNIKAQLKAFSISFSQKTPGTAGVNMTLREGTFSYQGADINIHDWIIPLAGDLSFELADALTEDPYPYYKSAYHKLQQTYNRIMQCKYRSIKTASGNGLQTNRPLLKSL